MILCPLVLLEIDSSVRVTVRLALVKILLMTLRNPFCRIQVVDEKRTRPGITVELVQDEVQGVRKQYHSAVHA